LFLQFPTEHIGGGPASTGLGMTHAPALLQTLPELEQFTQASPPLPHVSTDAPPWQVALGSQHPPHVDRQTAAASSPPSAGLSPSMLSTAASLASSPAPASPASSPSGGPGPSSPGVTAPSLVDASLPVDGCDLPDELVPASASPEPYGPSPAIMPHALTARATINARAGTVERRTLELYRAQGRRATGRADRDAECRTVSIRTRHSTHNDDVFWAAGKRAARWMPA
jgi:hypothetical protein